MYVRSSLFISSLDRRLNEVIALCSSKGRLLIFRIQSKFALAKNKGCSGSVDGVGNAPLAGDHEPSSSSSCTSMVMGESAVHDAVGQDEHKIADSESWSLSLVSQTGLNGMILAVSPYLEQYVLASAGNNVSVLNVAELWMCSNVFPSQAQWSPAALRRDNFGRCFPAVVLPLYQFTLNI